MTRNIRSFHFSTGDTNWEEYGGVWAKEVRPRVYHFISWEVDDENKSAKPWGWVPLSEVDLLAIPQKNIESALKSYGLAFGEDGLVDGYSGIVMVSWDDDDKRMDEVVADICRSYGFRAPLDESYGKAPVKMLSAMALYSEQLARGRRVGRWDLETSMYGTATHSELMERTVNKIGSTAVEIMRGDIDSALRRLDGSSRFDVLYNDADNHEVLTEWEVKWRGHNNPRMK